MEKYIKRIFIILTVLMILVPLVLTATMRCTSDINDTEIKLNPPPSFVDDPAGFITRYNRWFVKNFTWRKKLLSLYQNVKFYCLGENPIPRKVLIGEEGFLFYTDDGDGNPVAQYQDINPFTENEINDMHDALTRLRSRLAKHGIKLYIIIAANKETVYSDKMGNNIQKLGMVSQTDQVCRMLRQTGIPFTDTRTVLKEQRTQTTHDLFYKTDTHWNKLGAYYAYRASMEIIKKDFPALQPVTAQSIDPGDYTNGGDLTVMMGIEHYPYYQPVDVKFNKTFTVVDDTSLFNIVTKGRKDLPRAIIYRDSFGVALIPYLSNNFSFIRHVWITRRGMNYSKDKRIITIDVLLKDRPDIVIIELVERYLGNLMFL